MTTSNPVNELQEQMRTTVRDWIRAYAEAEHETPSKYWHPLSQPTFDETEIVEALDSMCRFRTSMGEKTRQFEEQFAEHVGCADAVMVNSGSSADLLAAYLLADPVKPLLNAGDEVLLPAVTWPTQIWSVLMAGLHGRLVDVDPQTLTMDLEDLQAKITPRTKAIFVVHLMGCPMDMTSLQAIADRHNLILLEDCCEALGARWNGQAVGTFGLAGTFSFFFSHHMTTMEGGMITCQDAAVGAQLRALRAHGWARDLQERQRIAEQYRCDPRYLFVNWGFNVRPTEVQAGFGLQQLRRLNGFNQRRNALAERFHQYIDRNPWLQQPRLLEGAEASWFSLPLLVSPTAPFTRDQLAASLEAAGIETRAIVTGNLARQPAAQLFPQLHAGPLPGADAIHDRGIYLGLTAANDAKQMDRLIHTVEGCLRQLTGTERTWRQAA